MTATPPFSGFGLGLRPPHHADFLAGGVPVDFVEVISENFMVEGGRPLATLDAVRELHPVALHGVSMSIGSVDGLDSGYLARLKQLAERVQPIWLSDHLCWTGIDGHNSHDLLPLPYTQEALEVVCRNIHQAQDMLQQAILCENPSSYVRFPESALSEWEFLSEMCRRTGCDLLLDLNNVYVSARNHGFDPLEFLTGLPLERVRQIHLAGHRPGDMLIDTHDRAVCDGVWALYAKACEMIEPVAVMIERDDAIPPLAELLEELQVARDIAAVKQQAAA